LADYQQKETLGVLDKGLTRTCKAREYIYFLEQIDKLEALHGKISESSEVRANVQAAFEAKKELEQKNGDLV